MVYITNSGDMWDKIAHEQMGSENFMNQLIEENQELIDIVVFPAGIEVAVPEVDDTQTEMPPWRQGLDDAPDALDEFEEDEDE